MSDDGTTTWQPLSELAQIERGIDEQFDNTRELYEHLCPAVTGPTFSMTRWSSACYAT